MGQALYRKYRSRTLSEIVGQEHITKTLQQALKQGRISHAYLLTGPRGVGKTSIARIMAHEINGLPYTDDSPHMDIIEIDAASNRRIDEIRELRDKVYVAPTEAQYKVYIIDEVHMLTREAFNALLKTLEEPPAHVIFILATTDAHKLPETIISRTQRFSFKPVAPEEVVAHLSDIAKKEKITVSNDALQLLAEHGEGSFRDSISMLDQASSHGGKLELDDVQRLLGIPPATAIRDLLRAIATGADTATLMTRLSSLYDQGYQAMAIAKQLGQAIRGELIRGQPSMDETTSLQLLSGLITVPTSHDPSRFLEIVVLRNAGSNSGVANRDQTAKPDKLPSRAQETDQPVAKPDDEPPKLSIKPTKAPKQTATKSKLKLDEDSWLQVLAALKQKHNTLYSVVRMAQPKFLDQKNLQLIFAFPFHKKRINEAGNYQMLIKTIQEITGEPVVVECIIDETATAPKLKSTTPKIVQEPAELTAISNIFGGGELLES